MYIQIMRANCECRTHVTMNPIDHDVTKVTINAIKKIMYIMSIFVIHLYES